MLTPEKSPRATNFRERPSECQVPAQLRELWLPTLVKGLGAQLEHIFLTRFATVSLLKNVSKFVGTRVPLAMQLSLMYLLQLTHILY